MLDFFYVDTLRRLKKEQQMELSDIGNEMDKKINCKIKKELKR